MSLLGRRQFLRLAGVLGAASAAGPALAACATSDNNSAQSTPVRIGLLAPQSGPTKAIGDDLTAGFQLYLNLHGGRLGGHPVQLVPMDEGQTADSGRAAVDKLIKEHAVQVMTGVASSTVMSGIRDQIEAAQVPLVGSNASPSSLGSVKYIWRTSYVNDEAGQALGGHLAMNGGEGVYVISDDSVVAGEQVNGFVRAFNGMPGHAELIGDPAQVPLISNPNVSLGSYVAGVRASGARSVFAAFTGSGAAAFVKAYRSAGITAHLYAPGFVTEGANALRDVGDAATGVYTSMNYSPDLDNGANRTFASAYQQAYTVLPSTYAMASYDAAAVLDKALQLAAGDLAPQTINTALSGVGELDSPRGSWQFNQSRTPLQRWYLRQVRKEANVLTNALLSDLAMLG